MPSFAELMAISATQTRESDIATKSLLAERQRKEAIARERAAENDRKERQMQAERLQKKFEDERRERERQERAEEDERKREERIQKRVEQQRNALLYGPKKSKPEKQVGEGHGPRKARDVSDSVGSGAAALTREEKRQRRQAMDLNRSFPAKRTSQTSAYRKAPTLLRGGAIDAPTNANAQSSQSSASSTQSVKARISAIPNTLTKLNVVKRDTRTIDEILQDRAKARDTKVIDGDEAREFHDWFPNKKDAAIKSLASAQPSASPSSSRAITPNPPTSQPKSPAGLARHSPALTGKPSPTKGSSSGNAASNSKDSSRRHSLIDMKPPLSHSKVPGKTLTSTPSSLSSKFGAKDSAYSGARSSASNALSANGVSRKRPHSSSLSPPPKRRAVSSGPRNDISSEIWKLFGKDRDRYVRNDVLSDDEDMEVDADALRKEELMSARLAKREDERALEEERRHEEEKRRRRKEKEARERRG